jgi:hypothetical protein
VKKAEAVQMRKNKEVISEIVVLSAGPIATMALTKTSSPRQQLEESHNGHHRWFPVAPQ